MGIEAKFEALEAALARAKADETEACAVGYVPTECGPLFYAHAKAIRMGIEARIAELTEVKPGEVVPVSGLIEA